MLACDCPFIVLGRLSGLFLPYKTVGEVKNERSNAESKRSGSCGDSRETQKSQSVMFLDYRGLTVSEVTELRNKMSGRRRIQGN